jgi:sodium/proline symporter
MVLDDHIRGLYVVITIYFVVVAICAYWGHTRQVQLSHAGVSDKLTSHYLGGRSIGPLLTTGTIFASFYSGYTVVGIPNEAFQDGWMAMRWVAAGFAIITGYFGTGLRLRKAALVRNHSTPVDFVTDRFQSQVLRYTVLFLQVVPAVFYIMAQVVALKTTFNSIFNLEKENPIPTIAIMTITLLFEWVGGISCVALTDCVQGGIMFVALIVLPMIIAAETGGWQGLDPTDYPKPQFYSTPSTQQQLGFWQFTIQTFTFFTLPHLMQRTYAARDLKSLKYAYTTLTAGMWFMMAVGVFVGTVGVDMLGEDILAGKTFTSPYVSILEKVMDSGVFAKMVGLTAFTASVAAIMSTADSLLIAISQLVTQEVVYPLRPDASPEDMTWVGRGVSLVAAILATIMG